MRRLILILALLLVRQAGADVFYVCPDFGIEYGAENGTSLATCFDGSSGLSANAAAVDPGDTVYMCGDWGPNDTRFIIGDSGTAGNYITMSGNAAACGRTRNSTIDRQGITGTNSRAISGAGRNYIKFEDLTIRNCNQYCLIWDFAATTGVITDDTALWVQRVTFEACGDPACLWHRGANLLVEDSVFDGCWEDCVWHRGKNAEVHDSTFENISFGSTQGDGIQIDGSIDDILTPSTDSGVYAATGNVIDHTDKDVKYCILIGPSGGADSAITVIDNTCYGYQETENVAASNHGILVDTNDDDTEILILNNYVSGTRIGITLSGYSALAAYTTRARISGNRVSNPDFRGIYTDGNVEGIDIVNNTVSGAETQAIYLGNTSAQIVFSNNAMIGSGVGLFYIGAPTSRTHNAYFGNTTNISDNGTPGSTTTGDLTADPLFQGGAVLSDPADFLPTPGSPLVNAGTCFRSIGCAYADPRGRQRGSDPDIGALELGQGDAAARVVSLARASAVARGAATVRAERQ